ncbi:hypothetical protein BCEP27_20834 [Burkholderia cepacia]
MDGLLPVDIRAGPSARRIEVIRREKWRYDGMRMKDILGSSLNDEAQADRGGPRRTLACQACASLRSGE